MHGIKVSNDGLVYISDRGGKRVLVFRLEGTFVAQTFIDRWCEGPSAWCGNGQTVAITAFCAASTTFAASRFLYIASRSPGSGCSRLVFRGGADAAIHHPSSISLEDVSLMCKSTLPLIGMLSVVMLAVSECTRTETVPVGRLTGQLVDSACYVKDKSNTRIAHQGMGYTCAEACARDGFPVWLVTADGKTYQV